MEIKKTFSSESLFFNKIILKPKISDIFVKSISSINSSGTVTPIMTNPFYIDDIVNINSLHKDSIAIEIVFEHNNFTSNTEISDYIDVDISRIRSNYTGVLKTKPVEILCKNYIAPIIKIDNSNGVIVSADVSVRGISSDGRTLFNESLNIGIGDSKEYIYKKDGNIEFDKIRFFKDGIVSKYSKSTSIDTFDEDTIYICHPKYINSSEKKSISENIEINSNNNIFILNKDTYKVECSITATILDTLSSYPIIKYIGVVSR